MIAHRIYQSFVDVNLSQQLHHAGLNVKTNFIWIIRNGEANLYTEVFDKDKYYMQAEKNVDFINTSYQIPAFELKDIESLLPDYLLSRNGKEYELSCSNLFEIDIMKHDRLPDVFALTVLKALEQRKIILTT